MNMDMPNTSNTYTGGTNQEASVSQHAYTFKERLSKLRNETKQKIHTLSEETKEKIKNIKQEYGPRVRQSFDKLNEATKERLNMIKEKYRPQLGKLKQEYNKASGDMREKIKQKYIELKNRMNYEAKATLEKTQTGQTVVAEKQKIQEMRKTIRENTKEQKEEIRTMYK
jgi:phosphoglycerate-specific signal transduction histidine kinase